MGYRHSRDEIVAAAAAVALEHGMAGLTFRRVADHLGISDRMVVYYLPSKSDLVLATVGALSGSLQQLLGEAFGDGLREPDVLARSAWPVLTTPEADRVFALFFEITGLAAAGTTPYDQLAPAMVGAWRDWLTERTVGRSPAARRAAALGVMAMLDGLLLLRQTVGAAAADEAACALGIAPHRAR
jgi:AcrR family transcriptional regulator